MLVLTRRENEKIVFPEVDITVELISIAGNRARLGVSAPKDLRILRDEIAQKEGEKPAKRTVPTKESVDAFARNLRERLDAATVAAEALRLQLDSGNLEDADESAAKVLGELAILNHRFAVGSTQQAAPMRGTHTPRALLVEDDPNQRQLLAGYLRMTGFEVDTADDGQDALEYLQSHDRPDFVLLDMVMPRIDGPTAVGEIRRDPKLQGLKIFAISGASRTGLGLETGPGGVDRWFEKPVNPQELVREMACAAIPSITA